MEVHRRLQLRVVDSSEGFYKLKQRWGELVCEIAECPPFLTWEWMYTWWEIYKTNSMKLLLLVISNDSGIVAIAPLYVRKSALFFIPCNTIYFLGTGEPESKEVCSEYLDFVCIPSYSKEACSVVKAYFLEKNKDWDRIKFQRILQDSVLTTYLTHDAFEEGYVMEKERCGFRYFVSLPEQWDMYMKSLKPSMRRSIKVAHKKISESSSYRIEEIKKESQIKNVMQELNVLHTKSWEAKGKPGAFSSREFCEFHLKIAKQFHKNSMLQIMKVCIGNEVLAILYNFTIKSCIYYYQSGLDLRKYASYKPGVLLHSEAIRSAIAKGIKKYDFMMAGTNSYKSQYGCETCEMFHINIWNKGVKVGLLQKLALLPYFRWVK